MQEETKTTFASGSASTAAIIGIIYATVQEFSGNLALNPLNPDVTFNVAIFVPALAAILFGANVGGLSAGLGSAFIEVKDVLFGEAQLAELPVAAIINSLASYAGAYLTGYLTKQREFFPQTVKQVFTSFRQWRRIVIDTMAAIIGLALTSSFTLAYGSQIIEGGNLLSGVPTFLEFFFANTSVLIVFVPLGLLLFDWLLVFLAGRGLRLDESLRQLEYEITETGGAEFLSVELPENALTQGSWTPMEIKFKNNLEQASPFHIECVSTGKVYPSKDKSKSLQPGEEWKQTFYVLAGKQKKVDLRIQITPMLGKAFKQELADDTTINLKGSTLDPSKYSLGLAQFSGINFGVLGVTIVWDDIVQFFANPGDALSGAFDSISLLALTAVIEGVLLALVMGVIYYFNKRKKVVDDFLLTFSSDQDAHGYEEIQRKVVSRILQYQRFFLPVFRGLLILASLGTIGWLGYEGLLAYTNPQEYSISDEEALLFLVLSGVLLGVWVVALKGIELIGELTKKGLPPWVLQPGNVILDFKPKGPIKIDEPAEVLVMAQNPTDKPGIRIVFESLDNISPPMVELHAAPGEVVNFKIAVTAFKQETRDILALFYPFFDEDGNELSFSESEPFGKQEIKVQVQPQTAFGITKDQRDQLLQFGGIGTAVTAALAFAQQFIATADIAELYAAIQENAPYLAALQAPFAYAYFYIRNKYLNGAQAVV